MAHDRDPRIDEAHAIPMAEMVDRLGIAGLRPMSGELIGPCPICGGRDRFGINLASGAFLCRKCDLRGGDQIALVRGVLGLEFRAALQWICGDAPAEISQAEIERRRAKAAEADRKQRAAQERYRRRAISDARKIWDRARDVPLDAVRDYLGARGLAADRLPSRMPALRCLLDHPYVKKIGGALVTAHRGPCMIAGVLSPADCLVAVHQTWIDPPRGKARIIWQGDPMPSKLVRGSKKGGAIRLHDEPGSSTLVMGEGIETTLTALVSGGFDGASFWAGVDLGNMAGRMARQSGVKHSGIPDMEDAEAFLPPPWVTRLVYLMDGDSCPKMTRAKLECGLRRAMAHRPGLEGQIVAAPRGLDFNDLLMGVGSAGEGEEE